MSEVIVVENAVTDQCMWRLHFMSNQEFDMEIYMEYGIYGWADMHVTREAGVYHLRAEWPYRGVLDIQAEGWPRFRRLVVWPLVENGLTLRVSRAILYATAEYTRLFGGIPEYAFVRNLPEGAEFGQDVHGLILLEADWMMRNCVAVGGRR